MGRSGKVTSDIKEAWGKFYMESVAAGASPNQVYLSLASNYEVSPATVRYHLNANYRERRSLRGKELYEQKKTEKEVVEQRAVKKRERRKDYEDRYWAKKTFSQKDHRAALYKLQKKSVKEWLAPIFKKKGEGESLTIEDIIAETPTILNGVTFKRSTLEGQLQKVLTDFEAGKIRGPPYLLFDDLTQLYSLTDDRFELG